MCASTMGENGIGKESAVCRSYVKSLCVVVLPAEANRVVTFLESTESESPGYEKGVPILVTK